MEISEKCIECDASWGHSLWCSNSNWLRKKEPHNMGIYEILEKEKLACGIRINEINKAIKVLKELGI